MELTITIELKGSDVDPSVGPQDRDGTLMVNHRMVFTKYGDPINGPGLGQLSSKFFELAMHVREQI